MPVIRELCDARTAKGYRRITALLNRLLAANDERVNHKRVYRLMKQDGLLLPSYPGRPQDRCHDGQVITLKPDPRCCSDGFEIRRWKKEVVRLAFSLDCCDRELMRYVATTGGITAEMVQDLLLESLEYRFGQSERVPHPLEWLTDNGICYIAKETQPIASSRGFVVCTTPVRSPQSNGMAEAIMKKFKRDYVYLNDRPNAATVMAKLPEWIEDYYRSHPHKVAENEIALGIPGIDGIK